MAIQVRGRHQDPVSVAVTMRTPGNDFELAAGFLVTEGLVHDLHEIAGIRYCDVAPDEQHYNVVTVDLTVPFGVDFAERHFFASSSCGICGKASLDQIEVNCPMIEPGPVVARSTIVSLPDALRRSQPIFEQTGGLHAAALFDTDGRLLESREDVGRHNAVDKLIGNALLNARMPLRERLLLVSGRVSFEIVQKAAVVGIPITCAVSAPSSLAVQAGERLGMTVVGFLRGTSSTSTAAGTESTSGPDARHRTRSLTRWRQAGVAFASRSAAATTRGSKPPLWTSSRSSRRMDGGQNMRM